MGLFTSTCVERKLRPDVPFDAEYPLSIIDGMMPKINSRYLFIFDTRSSPEDIARARSALATRLGNALQSILRAPEAGTLALPELLGDIYMDESNGMLSLRVTKASAASFIISTRDDMRIEDLRPEAGYPRQCMDGKVFATGIEPFSLPESAKGSRAFSTQLTFIKGGYVICVNKHHSLLDATATSKLIKWWLSKARSLGSGLEGGDCRPDAQDCMIMHDRRPLTHLPAVPQQNHPNFRIVPNATPSVFGMTLPPLWVLHVFHYLPTKLVGNTRSHTLHFSATSLQRLKTATGLTSSARLSTNDALVALVWTSVARARSSCSSPEAQTSLSSCSIILNIRPRLTPPLPPTYFGNAVCSIATYLPLSTLTSSAPATLSTAATALRATLNTQGTDAPLRSMLQLFASAPKISDVQMSIKPSAGTDLYMNSWEGLFSSCDELHLGYGTFQAMRLPAGAAFAGFANVLPAYGMRDVEGGNGLYPGGLEVMLDLKAGDMERLLGDIGFMEYVDRVI